MRGPAAIGSFVFEEEVTPWGAAITAAGELDLGAVPELRKRLGDALGRGVRRLLLDLDEVTFIDSISLAAIVAARRRMGDAGRMAVVTRHPYVLLILEAGGLDSVIDVYPTRFEAEAALSG